jgi:hypothetical protein
MSCLLPAKFADSPLEVAIFRIRACDVALLAKSRLPRNVQNLIEPPSTGKLVPRYVLFKASTDVVTLRKAKQSLITSGRLFRLVEQWGFSARHATRHEAVVNEKQAINNCPVLRLTTTCFILADEVTTI